PPVSSTRCRSWVTRGISAAPGPADTRLGATALTRIESGAAILLCGLERRRRIHAAALARELERTIGELGGLGATDRLALSREGQYRMTQQLGVLEGRRWD